MPVFFSQNSVIDLIYLLPELLLIFSILQCLLTIARVDLQLNNSIVTRKLNVTALILKLTLFNLQIILVVISFLFLFLSTNASNLFSNIQDSSEFIE